MERVLKNETPLNENAKVKGKAKGNTTKFITLNGIGIALFVVLTMCLVLCFFCSTIFSAAARRSQA